MEVIIGTYEEIIVGWNLQENKDGFELVPSFTDHSHVGSVRSVSTSDRGVLASGSADERIHLFNLKRRQEIGSIIHHNGTVNRIKFFGKKYMFSASDDGVIAVWHSGKWECLRSLRGHKEAVRDFDIHPSGKLAVSVSKDKSMRTWNLITGKCAYITSTTDQATKQKIECEIVLWSPDGNSYCLIFQNRLQCCNVGTAAIYYDETVTFRIECAKFLQGSLLVLAGSNGMVSIYDIANKSRIHRFQTNTNRVKEIAVCGSPGDPDERWLVTASSDGNVKIWWIYQQDGEWHNDLVAKAHADFRPVCLTLYNKDEAHEPAKECDDEAEAADSDDLSVEMDDDSEEEESAEESEKEKPTVTRKSVSFADDSRTSQKKLSVQPKATSKAFKSENRLKPQTANAETVLHKTNGPVAQKTKRNFAKQKNKSKKRLKVK